MEVSTFTCSICDEPSQRICVYCTKDSCGNHLCHRCLRCSDCCACGTPGEGVTEEVPVNGHLSNGGLQIEEELEETPVEGTDIRLS